MSSNYFITGSESAIKKPGPSAQNVEHYLDAVNFQRSKFVFSPLVDEIHAEDKVDEIEDIDPNSETSVAGTSKSYIGKRVRPNADNIVVVLAKRLKERDTNFLSQQEKRHNDVDFFFKRVAEIIKTFPEISIIEAKVKVLMIISKLVEDEPQIFDQL
ncbi:unnamed protein product [Macrosiphum euphorbiae]|uniref:BESS domain-containing protein n=1 Tax=Macrosiphum euphorbiae TaxID=13131 RepID=A0AAV0XB20_9HEMI|nr:unnamed protein product [Macrosiphum euphorbiae]